jgi:hypothetical protein
MSQEVSFNFKKLNFTLFAALLLFAGCSIFQGPQKNTNKILKGMPTRQRVFFATYDQVWRAAQLTLKYPMAINNMDNGILETEFINAMEGFISPTESKAAPSGIRYRVRLTIAKGKAESKEAIRVTVNKYIERKKDFFAVPEQIESDGLEEKIILYRIDRELTIDEGLRKAVSTGG